MVDSEGGRWGGREVGRRSERGVVWQGRRARRREGGRRGEKESEYERRGGGVEGGRINVGGGKGGS